MAPRKRKADKEPEAKLSLAAALDFIKIAQHDKAGDLLARSHCRLAHGQAVAFDGVIAVGHPIEEELSVCPHTYRLIDALARCKKAVSITQLDADKLVIKSGNFRAVVPCLNHAALPYASPDVKVGEITDVIKEGFTALNPIISGTGNTVVEASLLLGNNSMVATDRNIMFEFWHGINLPDGLAIPKAAVTAVSKISAPLVGIGVSDRTVTFHYDGGLWLRTQLYADPWPNIAGVLAGGDYYTAPEVPPSLMEAVAAVAPFSENGHVYTFDGFVSSHGVEGVGATYVIEGLTPGYVYNAKHLLMIKDVAKRIDLIGKNGVSYFFGDRVRGAMTQVRK